MFIFVINNMKFTQMKKISILFLILLYAPIMVFSQNTKKNPYDVNFNLVTEAEPYYEGGDITLFSYLANNIVYSEDAKSNKIFGKVMVSFDVMPDSTLSDINVISGVGYGIDSQIVNLLKPVLYIPGVRGGERMKMNVIITVPVRAE